jgi:Tol biopolymer transport system component
VSADGKRLLYQRGQGAQADLYVANLDGTGETARNNSKADETAPAWADDTSGYVYQLTTSGGSESRIYLADTSSAATKNGSLVTVGEQPAVHESPDAA